MSDAKIAMVYVVLGGGSKPGGFGFRNLGPDKDKNVVAGERFPAEWVNPNTLEKYIEEGHMKYVEDGNEPKTPEAPKGAEGTEGGDEVYGLSQDQIEEHCVFEIKDIKDTKRAELDTIVEEIFAECEVDVPKIAKIEDVKVFLTQGVK